MSLGEKPLQLHFGGFGNGEMQQFSTARTRISSIIKVTKIKDYSREVKSAFSSVNILHRQRNRHSMIWVKWEVPLHGSTKLNVDGF